jgi:hypothetical protein
MAALNNPGLAGDVPFDTVISASSGVNYSVAPALVQYRFDDTPGPVDCRAQSHALGA